MQTQVEEIKVKKTNKKITSVELGIEAYSQMPVPGFKGADFGVGFARVVDIPGVLEDYVGVNPRIPKRTASGALTGPVVEDIIRTLKEEPEEMALKNRGLFILAENVTYKNGKLQFALSDVGLHGLVDGFHTYSCIRQVVEQATEAAEIAQLNKAYVRVHIVQGLKADQVVEIASGMNTSRAVDDVSLLNLNGDFDSLRRILRLTPAADSISYNQGSTGAVPVATILAYLSTFDFFRYNDQTHAVGLYSRKSSAIRNYVEDLQERNDALQARIELLPDILRLVDDIRIALPEAVKRGGLKMGMLKFGGERAGSKVQKGRVLPFTGQTADYKIPSGWLMPVLNAMRANLREDKGVLGWRVNPKVLLNAVIDDLADILVNEHKASGGHPDKVGKNPSVYRAAYDRVSLHLAKKRLL